jgi:hypothetical protein
MKTFRQWLEQMQPQDQQQGSGDPKVDKEIQNALDARQPMQKVLEKIKANAKAKKNIKVQLWATDAEKKGGVAPIQVVPGQQIAGT